MHPMSIWGFLAYKSQFSFSPCRGNSHHSSCNPYFSWQKIKPYAKRQPLRARPVPSLFESTVGAVLLRGGSVRERQPSRRQGLLLDGRVQPPSDRFDAVHLVNDPLQETKTAPPPHTHGKLWRRSGHAGGDGRKRESTNVFVFSFLTWSFSAMCLPRRKLLQYYCLCEAAAILLL